MVSFVDEVHYGGEDGRLDFSHLGGGIFFSRDFVESTEAAAESGVKMIFNIIVSSGCVLKYLPRK